jgi:mxaJ protein
VTICILAASLRAEEKTPTSQPARARTVLRVAADPNNLPFSNDKLQGFENRIAELIARDLGARLEYVWHAQRRGFVRQTMKEGDADLMITCPAGFERVLTTKPYFRSTYVFVTRKDSGIHVSSLDDPALKRLKIGVQITGEANTPPAQALGRRGIVDNVVGITVYGDYRQPNPPARLIDAVARRQVDVAIAWGPLAGYFARREPVTLELTPVTPEVDPPALPLAFDVSVGVRKNDKALRDRVDQILARRRAEIDRILDDYGVPRAAPLPAAQQQALDRFNPDDDDHGGDGNRQEVISCCD